MNKTELLQRLARDGEERLLLARALDKLELARDRGAPAHTGFLSPHERALIENGLIPAAGWPRHLFSGGWPGAERTTGSLHMLLCCRQNLVPGLRCPAPESTGGLIRSS